MEMKKFKEITLLDIKKYFNYHIFDYNLALYIENINGVDVLEISRFDESYEGDMWICSIYFDKYNNLMVRTDLSESSFNETYNIKCNNMYKIETIVKTLLSMICDLLQEEIELKIDHYDFIDYLHDMI